MSTDISSLRNKIMNKLDKIKRVVSVQLSALLILSAFAGALPSRVVADGVPEPTISTGSDITGAPGTQISVSGLTVNYSGSSQTVPVTITSDTGILQIDTAGLNLQWLYESDTRKSFAGSLSDVNTALSRLKYKNYGLATAHIQVTTALLNNNFYYNPINQHVYHLNTSVATHADAMTSADSETFNDFSNTSFSGYLATVTSQSENSFIHSFLHSTAWLSGSDAASEGTWKWIDGPEAGTTFWQGGQASAGGMPVDGAYSNWNPGEPNNYGSGQNCNYMYADGTWDDLNCTNLDNTVTSYVTEFGSPGNTPTISSTSFTINTVRPTNVVSVSNCTDLQNIAASPESYSYNNIKLSQDIDCGGQTIQPLFYDSNFQFHGTFDGNGFSISNFNISLPNDLNVGLIGYASGANIKNLTISSNVSIDGSNCVGSIVGIANNSSIINSSSQASLQAEGNNAGGIVGCYYGDDGSSQSISDNSFDGTISLINSNDTGGILSYASLTSSSTLNLSGNAASPIFENMSNPNYFGGISGGIDVSTNSKIIIDNNEVHVDLGQSSYSAGIVGYLGINSGSISEVKGNYAAINSSDGFMNGGIIGIYFVITNSTSLVSGNTTTGNITSSNPDGYQGGIVGAQITVDSSTSDISDNSSSININAYLSVGGIAGIQYDEASASSTIERNINSGDITGSQNVGGIVGNITNNNSNIIAQQNISTGAISGDYNIGGITGFVDTYNNAMTSVVDSYQTGLITGNYNDPAVSGAGGIVGSLKIDGTGPGNTSIINVSNDYSTGAINGPINMGGLIGHIFDLPTDGTIPLISITNSFSTGEVMLTHGLDVGALVGNSEVYNKQDLLISAGLYYDKISTNQTDCNGGVGQAIYCTAVNTQDNPSPDYFKNPANAPMSNWNFVNIWGTNPNINDGLPCLQWANAQCAPAADTDGDGVINSVESTGPNNGDSNGDGIQDFIQPNVSSLPNATDGTYVVTQSSCGLNSKVSSSNESSLNVDPNFKYPAGLTSFTTTCASEGATATITQYYYGDYDPSKLILRKFNSISGTYTTIDGAVFSTTKIGGKTVIKVVYSITDGGPFDEDGTANGVIVDPVGIAQATVIAPNTGLGSN